MNVRLAQTSATEAALPEGRERGVTPRVVIICLLLALLLGYLIPVVDYKLFNTFLGATHLPTGAIGALLMLVLVVNPLLRLISIFGCYSKVWLAIFTPAPG